MSAEVAVLLDMVENYHCWKQINMEKDMYDEIVDVAATNANYEQLPSPLNGRIYVRIHSTHGRRPDDESIVAKDLPYKYLKPRTPCRSLPIVSAQPP